MAKKRGLEDVVLNPRDPKQQKTLPPIDFLLPLIPDGWACLRELAVEDEWQGLVLFLLNRKCYPAQPMIFRALALTPLSEVRVVILGQDPYHGKGQATGLAFHVPAGVKSPPSLRNIIRQVRSEMGEGEVDLEDWARQGVLLLNPVLTVDPGEADSHKGRGWEQVTDRIIEEVNRKEQRVFFLLWGKKAQAKKKMIDQERHTVIETPHPSPLSAYRGFFDVNQFTQVNEGLDQPITWVRDE